MAELKGNNPITANGDYEFDLLPGLEYLIELDGTFDSATIKLQRKRNGATTDIPGTSLTASGRYLLRAGHSGRYNLNVADVSSACDVDVAICALNPGNGRSIIHTANTGGA